MTNAYDVKAALEAAVKRSARPREVRPYWLIASDAVTSFPLANLGPAIREQKRHPDGYAVYRNEADGTQTHLADFPTMAEAFAASGQPCAWFALCDRPAVTVSAHAILGAVPTCKRCSDFADSRPE